MPMLYRIRRLSAREGQRLAEALCWPCIHSGLLDQSLVLLLLNLTVQAKAGNRKNKKSFSECCRRESGYVASKCAILIQGVFQAEDSWERADSKKKEKAPCSLLLLSVFSRVQLYNRMDCSLPGSSVHGMLQARILEWVAMPSSRGSSRPRDPIWVSWTAGRFSTTEPLEKPLTSPTFA